MLYNKPEKLFLVHMVEANEAKAQSGLVRLHELENLPKEIHGEQVEIEVSRGENGRYRIIERHEKDPLIATNPNGRKYLQDIAATAYQGLNTWKESGARGVYRTPSRNFNAGLLLMQETPHGEHELVEIIKSYDRKDSGQTFALDCIAGGPNLKRNLSAVAVEEGIEEAVIFHTGLGKLMLPAGYERYSLERIVANLHSAMDLGLQIPDDLMQFIIQANEQAGKGDLSSVHSLPFADNPVSPLRNDDVTIIDSDGTANTFTATCVFHEQGADAMFTAFLPPGDLRMVDTECLHDNGVERKKALARQHGSFTRQNLADLWNGTKTKAKKITPYGVEEYWYDPKQYPWKPLGKAVAQEILLM